MSLKIGNIEIGERIIIVAEIGGNHNGDFDLAKRLIIEAAKNGADIVKFQTYQAEKLVSKSLPPLKHVQGIHKTLHDRLNSLQFNKKQWIELKEVAEKNRIVFLSTPFDIESADFLDPLIPAFKIASGDLENYPLIKHIAKKNKPIILSCGMASELEIKKTIELLPVDKTILLHCVAKYPTALEEVNLLSIRYLQDKVNLPVGYSDHTIGISACIAAAAMGAILIEKHFTMNKNQPVGDHLLSADPSDLYELVKKVREIEKMRGIYGKPTNADNPSRKWLRRSIYSKVDIEKGTKITEDMLLMLRPADGIPSEKIIKVIGSKAKIRILKGTLLSWDVLQ